MKNIFILIFFALFSFPALGQGKSPLEELVILNSKEDAVKYGYGQLGMGTLSDGNILMVVSPSEGSPAERAGLRTGDKILKIDGIHTNGLSHDEATSKIRGEPGTKVTLTIQRGNEEPVDYEITREIKNIKSEPYAGLQGTEEEAVKNDYNPPYTAIIVMIIFMTIGFIPEFIRSKRKISSPKLRREKRIKSLVFQIKLAEKLKRDAKLLQEELDLLKKERENENRDILVPTEQKEKLIFELKKELEDLKKLKIENEKLSGIISEQKKTILYLEMELKIKKSENEKLVY